MQSVNDSLGDVAPTLGEKETIRTDRASREPRPWPRSHALPFVARWALLAGALTLAACADEPEPSYDAGTSNAQGSEDGSTGGSEDPDTGNPNGSNDANGGSTGSPSDAGGSGAPGGDDSTTGGGAADAGSTDVPREDLGEGDGSDVLMIGDSWMSLGGASTAIQGGVLKASGQPYRAKGIGGTRLLGGFLTPIPNQYRMAIEQDPDVKTVIMTGGGNDILQSGLQADCDMMGEACGMQVEKILDALSGLWEEMAADGVQDVIYILYATPKGVSVDFALPTGDSAPARCAAVPAPLRCHILETLDLVMGDIPDGIHPSQEASDRIGKAVYDLMVERGMRR